jgi:SAM-dependent methyltransferase
VVLGHELPAEQTERSFASDGLKLVATKCCICGLDDATPIAVGSDFEYRTSKDTFLAVRCNRCSLVYLNPRPADDEAERIYPDSYHAFDFKPQSFGFVYRVRRFLEARRLKDWCRDLPANARILDVGCGDGFHLSLLQEFGEPGWRIEGVDTDERAIRAAEASGLVVHKGTIEKLELPDSAYDLVLLIMTIEHVSNPLSVMRAIARKLAPGGRLIVVTDNVASPDAWFFGGRHWGGYHFPRHYHLFDRKTLAHLAQVSFLECERVVTDFSPVNWTYSLRNTMDDWGAPSWLVNFFSLKSVPVLAIATAIDWPMSAFRRGAILRGTFRKALGS